jgi:hypothetical protein
MALPMRMCSMHKKGLDPTYACSVTQRCGFYGENPNAGVTSFNDLGLASLTVFQVLTLTLTLTLTLSQVRCAAGCSGSAYRGRHTSWLN